MWWDKFTRMFHEHLSARTKTSTTREFKADQLMGIVQISYGSHGLDMAWSNTVSGDVIFTWKLNTVVWTNLLAKVF
jgi:hypothetical protein